MIASAVRSGSFFTITALTASPVSASGSPMTPTSSSDLASAVAELLSREDDAAVEPGVYHVTSAGQCSWHDFAKEIFRQGGLEVDLSPITSGESGALARRPAYSVLDHGKWERAGFDELRPWQEALADYMKAKGHTS